jgi:hypothetical protein
MTVKYIIFLLLLSGICTESVLTIDTSSTKFLPLKIGNVWTYMRTGGWPPNAPPVFYKSKVERDSNFNGHKYYYLKNIEHLSPGNGANGWFRIDSTDGKLIRFGLYLCNQTHFENIDSLSSRLNDLSPICQNDTLHKRRLNFVTPIIRWGVQSVDMGFNWNGGPAGVVRQYSKYLGLSSSGYGEMNPLTYTLRGCIIDGVLYGDTNTFVGINQISSEVPSEFSLSQNYPNPFNPMTKLKFQMPKSGLAVLTFYDALGKEVQVLVNQELSPGTYEVDFDGSNLPSGVYFYKLESESFSQTKKMVLIK